MQTPFPRAPASAVPRPAMNRLLASLPADVQQRLNRIGSRVELEKAAVLVEVGAPQTHIFLPCSGLLSLQTMTHGGSSVEVAMVGREGVAPLTFIAGAPAAYTTVVSIPGDAWRLGIDALHAECDRSAPLHHSLMQQWHKTMSEIASGSACHRFHTARQRLARWLLSASDRIQSPWI